VGIDDEEVLGLDFFDLELFDFGKEGEGAFEEKHGWHGFRIRRRRSFGWKHSSHRFGIGLYKRY